MVLPDGHAPLPIRRQQVRVDPRCRLLLHGPPEPLGCVPLLRAVRGLGGTPGWAVRPGRAQFDGGEGRLVDGASAGGDPVSDGARQADGTGWELGGQVAGGEGERVQRDSLYADSGVGRVAVGLFAEEPAEGESGFFEREGSRGWV
uniref:(northern house mosquito) hypothetical protein n=1 Tax=Culex pipiens TaxID=7175 RepID=A0A8D8ADS8_CULPI